MGVFRGAVLDHDDFDAAGESPPVAIQESFETFYLREFPSMVALAASMSGSRTAAEDLAQEAMLRAHREWKRISQFDKPGAWVRRVTINLGSSMLRRRATEARARLRLVVSGREPFPEPSVEDEHVWAAVRRLPRRQRAAVALFYLEDRPVRDIAEILGCSESTAKVHLHRGRLALADILGAREEGEER